MSNHEEGLISQYVEAVQALGVRAENGEDIHTEVDTLVVKAVDHFRAVKTSDPQANLSVFQARLRMVGALAHSSQPVFKETLLRAANACPPQI